MKTTHLALVLAACLATSVPAWAADNRIGPCLEYLQRYGTHAKALLPQLREIRTQIQPAEQINKCIASIETSNFNPVLVSIAEFKTRPLARSARFETSLP